MFAHLRYILHTTCVLAAASISLRLRAWTGWQILMKRQTYACGLTLLALSPLPLPQARFTSRASSATQLGQGNHFLSRSRPTAELPYIILHLRRSDELPRRDRLLYGMVTTSPRFARTGSPSGPGLGFMKMDGHPNNVISSVRLIDLPHIT